MSLRDQLLQRPPCAVDISEHLKKIDQQALRDMFTQNKANFPENLDLSNLYAAQREIGTIFTYGTTFAPCGGADFATLANIGNAQINIITGGEAWGYLEDFDRLRYDLLPLRMFGMNADPPHNEGEKGRTIQGQRATFDPRAAWHRRDPVTPFPLFKAFEITPETMGPLSALRAVGPEIIEGNYVESMHIARLATDEDTDHLLDKNGNFQFQKMHPQSKRKLTLEELEHLSLEEIDKIPPDEMPGLPSPSKENNNVALWLGFKNGQTKSYVYRRHLIPSENGKSMEKAQSNRKEIHHILENVADEKDMMMIRKSVPDVDSAILQKELDELCNPPKRLLRAVACDKQLDRLVSQKLTVDGFQMLTFDLKPHGASFGYGQVIFFHADIDDLQRSWDRRQSGKNATALSESQNATDASKFDLQRPYPLKNLSPSQWKELEAAMLARKEKHQQSVGISSRRQWLESRSQSR